MGKNYEEFREHGKEMVDYICNYVKSLDKRSVALNVEPGFLVEKLAVQMPMKSESFKNVLDDFESKIMPGVLHWSHPQFYAYFGAGNAYPSVLAEMLSASIATIGFSWSSCPSLTELERIMLDWYAKALDLPDVFLSKNCNPKSRGGGVIQGSASDAVFACMCAARTRAIKILKGKDDTNHESFYLPKLVCYTSSEAHSCVQKAANLCLVKFRIVKPDANDSLRGKALEEAIAEDVKNGLTPFFVVATVGTTSQCAFDNLTEIGEVCKKHQTLWFHIDGAYGGNAFILPEMRKLKNGIELADSIDINPNKLLLTNFDTTCMWLKDCFAFTSAFTVDPVYLHEQHDSSVIDLRHFGTPLSRRFRSLKLFFMFRMYGLEELQAHVRQVIKMGEYFEKLVKADDRFEVLNEAILGLICFRLNKSDRTNQEFLALMNSSMKIHLTPASVKGKYVIRFVANQEVITTEQIDIAWKTIQDFAMQLLATPSRRLNPMLIDPKYLERYSFTKVVTKEEFEKLANSKLLGDGGTPLYVVATEEETTDQEE